MAKPETPRRPDRSRDSGQRSSIWLVFLLVLFVGVSMFYLKPLSDPRELTFSEFLNGVEKHEYHDGNVYELQIGEQVITFQNAPTPKRSFLLSPSTTETGTDFKKYRIYLLGIRDEAVEKLRLVLQKNGIDYRGTTPPAFDWWSLSSLLMMGLLLGSLLIFFRKMGGPGAAMSFSRSRGKLYAEDDVKITFDDVAGIEEAVDELREVVEFLRTPQKYQALGGRIPRGVLLVGPPGTGKTLLAKAVAGEAGVPFFSLSGSDFVELFVGVGAARVRDMFAQAVQKAPSIIFIDELDALGKRRGDGGPGNHDERDQTLNALLVEMDGFGTDQSVIVMGATNRPEILDPALMRPGRFDRHVLVDKPSYKGRAAILRVHSKKVKMAEDVNIDHLAKISPGFVGADLANLVNEAALLAARNNKHSVGMKEFEEAIDRVVAGLEKSSKIIHEDEKRRVAYHECGHALVACTLPQTDPVHKISIIPRGFGALGYMMQRPDDDKHLVTQTELHNRICVLLGGIAAEEVVFQETSTGPQNDLERATDIARRMVTEWGMSQKLGRVNYGEARRSAFLGSTMQGPADHVHSEQTIREIDLEVKRIIDECMATAREVLQSRRVVLEQLTKELIEIEVMDSERINKILDSHKVGPQIKPGTYVDPHGPTAAAHPAPAAHPITEADLLPRTGDSA
ncbi:ATP-dependent zinc metalloprotease FtsH [Planctomyces sp. SH-PL14]|uniref:ATP-dependent zinc metalloprotease FtsH n=1 Tax=Planctomyces sp. SH-PL14 TaxID=1632864 RepID=UPI00078CD343|nr:ATP-dependent zinc metalloprotease FtsH [Planctomyces sp. SH-PL14]AMV18376.1 ATP-dependent zinc metalloprotease FtsH 4 [Planctomyces sp. SH-PL14]